MRREPHVRFCERVVVRSHRATHLVLFADSKRDLWTWKAAIIERLAGLRLVIHDSRAQVLPVGAGIPWLGFVVFPTYRLVKGRKVRRAHRRLRARLAAYHAGEISFA